MMRSVRSSVDMALLLLCSLAVSAAATGSATATQPRKDLGLLASSGASGAAALADVQPLTLDPSVTELLATMRDDQAQPVGRWRLAQRGQAPAGPPASHHAPGEIHTKEHIAKSSLQDLSRQANNPVSTLWTLQNQFDVRIVDDIPTVDGRKVDDQVDFTWNFQPVLPLHLTKKFNLINRAVIPFVQSAELPDPSGGTRRQTDIGDIILASIVTPNKAQGFLWGIGPTWLFPSATNRRSGTGKWSIGPAVPLLYIGKEWIFGIFAQQWFSFAGGSDRDTVSQLDLKYVMWRLIKGGWQIGVVQDITANWEADEDKNRWTVPLGFGAGKTFKLGGIHAKIDFQISYAIIHPDDAGQRTLFRLRFTPIIPALCCKGALFK